MESNCFELTLTEKDDIHLEKAYPIVDEEGKNLTPYEFTITNTCEAFSNYQINLEVLDTTTFEDLSYMKVMLDDKVSLLTENEETTKTLENAKTSYKLRTGYLKENASRTYRLRLWMDENTPTDKAYMKKVFESKITIVANYLENLDNEIIAEATSLNERYGREESFSIHVTSEKYNLVAMSEDLEHWEELEEKGKEVNFERTYTENGTHKYYFMDEVDNVSDVNVNVTKIDDKKPTADIKVLKQDNLVTVNAGASKDNETSVVKYYYSRDGENFIESEESVYKFSEYNYGLATKVITEYLGWKVYVKVEDEVGNISDVKDYTISNTEGSLAYDGTVDNNLRYVGASPNNYVSFNNELWRIIGVMNNIMDSDGNLETRVKLARNESIGSYSFDSSGIEEWSEADAMKLLNPGYESESVGGSLYWNRQSGTCYNGGNNAKTSCDFTSIGLTTTARNLCDNVIWYTGMVDSTREMNTIQSYILERGSRVACTNCTDGVERKTSWLGYVGLLYPSDYGYSKKNPSCYSISLYDSGETNGTCKNDTWIRASWDYTISPIGGWPGYVAAISTWNGSVRRYVSGANAIYPTLYLKPKVKITSGLGTSSNPFVLSL